MILGKLSKRLKDRASRIVRSGWVNLGIPFDVPMLNEKKQGIVDVEALLMITLLLLEQDRLVTDLPSWVLRFSDVINHQKLKTMFKACPEKQRKILAEKINQETFGATPNAFRKIFRIKAEPSDKIAQTIEIRMHKLNSLDHIARSSAMISNRLLYGTGFRADLITVTQIKNLKMSGNQLAEVLCTANSTVSRILNDLRACRFLNTKNERVKNPNPFPGLFISFHSLRNLYELLDAEEFRSEELRKSIYENLDFSYDGFCRELIA